MSMTVEGQTSEREEIQKAGGVSDILLNSSALLLQPGQCGPAVCVCVCLVWVYLLPWTRCLLWDKLLSNRVFAWSPGCWFFSYWSKWVSATGCLCAAVQEHTVAYTCVFVSASHTPVRDCSHACYCNRTWGLRAACVRAAAEWSAQRGDWIVRRQPAAATSASEPTLHLLSWILIYAVQIVRQPNGHISPAKLAERDLDPFYSTWHEHEEHAIHCRVRVMGPIVRLLKCVAQHHTFGSNAKIITIFSLVQ